MEQGFWHNRWRDGQIGFHEAAANQYLVAQWAGLELAKNARILVPLCGKSVDLLYLQALGHEVVGVELSPMACEAFFVENELRCDREVRGAYMAFVGTGAATGITILCGDFFLLDPETAGVFDGVYDRAAIVALPTKMREDHVATVAKLVRPGGRGLLTTLSYPETEHAGPPFSVPPEEVKSRLNARFRIEPLATVEVPPRWEVSWLREHQFALTRR